VSLLIANLEASDRYLNKSAKKTMEALQTRARSEPSVIPHVVQGLVLGASGVHNFDTVSKTKTIRKLLAAADLASCQNLVPVIGGAIEQPQTNDEKEADARRKSYTDMLVALYSRTLAMAIEPNNQAIPAPKEVAGMILDVLVAIGYSRKPLGSAGRIFKPPPTSQCRAYIRTRIRTCLDQSLHDRQNKLDLLRHTIGSLREIQCQKKSDFALTEFDAATQEIVDKAWEGLSEMKKAVSLSHSTVTTMLSWMPAIANRFWALQSKICWSP
jgi:DNA polymerase phi